MNQIVIAITGGPSGGKTTLIDTLKKELGPQCTIVPEAASILYRGGFPRSKSIVGRVHVQKAIYYAQRELELLMKQENPENLIVCDRGSLDALAYWPEDSNLDFFNSVASNKEKELQRYDWVLHLDTAGSEFYDTTNPIRTESFSEAIEINEKIKKAWEGHSRRVVISQKSDFLSKIMTSLSVLKAIRSQQNVESVIKLALNVS